MRRAFSAVGGASGPRVNAEPETFEYAWPPRAIVAGARVEANASGKPLDDSRWSFLEQCRRLEAAKNYETFLIRRSFHHTAPKETIHVSNSAGPSTASPASGCGADVDPVGRTRRPSASPNVNAGQRGDRGRHRRVARV